MTNYARIQNNVVVEISENPALYYHPEVAKVFVEVPDQVGPKWTLVDEVWTPPVKEDVPENPIDTPSTPPSVPVEISMRQARLALLDAGKLAMVNEAISQIPGKTGDEARIEWEYSGFIRRDSPTVKAVAMITGMTDAEIDTLFIEANTK